MIHQIHHQSKKDSDKTEMVLQFDAQHREDIEKAIQYAWDKFPPPDGYQFMICNEESNFFWKCLADSGSK